MTQLTCSFAYILYSTTSWSRILLDLSIEIYALYMKNKLNRNLLARFNKQLTTKNKIHTVGNCISCLLLVPTGKIQRNWRLSLFTLKKCYSQPPSPFCFCCFCLRYPNPADITSTPRIRKNIINNESAIKYKPKLKDFFLLNKKPKPKNLKKYLCKQMRHKTYVKDLGTLRALLFRRWKFKVIP